MKTERAFPTPAHNLTNDGMTLRDYFAAKAMAALITCGDARWSEVAQEAYEFAEAMLAAREVK